MKFNNEELQTEFILATREFFAEVDRQCIEEANFGQIKVNDLAAHNDWREGRIAACLKGNYDGTLSHMQHAYYLQTGKEIALLP